MGNQLLSYHLCPQCYRATPASAQEVYCPNDGTLLLSHCSSCKAPITSPYAHYCAACGQNFGSAEMNKEKPP